MGNLLAKEEEADYWVPVPLHKLLTYGTGPFFVNPLKPLLLALDGADYRTAYEHFRRDHKVPKNILYHCVCMALQLTANYPLLACADEALFPAAGVGPIAASSTALWLWTLLFRTSGAPTAAKLGGAVAVMAAFASRHRVRRSWRWLALLMALVEAAGLQVFVVNKGEAKRDKRSFDLGQYLKILTPRLCLHYLAWVSYRGALQGRPALLLNALLALFAAKGSQAPFTSGLLRLSFLGLLGPLTAQPWLYFYTAGYMATVSQGVAHHYSGEPGTLPQLARVRDELAHIGFFPTLVCHTLHQSLRTGGGVTPVFA